MESIACGPSRIRQGLVRRMSGRSGRNPIAAGFGITLKHARRTAGLSQDQLAVRTDLYTTEISAFERGLRVAGIDTLVRLAGALDLAPEDLLKGMSDRPVATTPGRFE